MYIILRKNKGKKSQAEEKSEPWIPTEPWILVENGKPEVGMCMGIHSRKRV